LTIPALLSAVSDLGIVVRPDASNLRLTGRTSNLTAELREELIAKKPEILALIAVPGPLPLIDAKGNLRIPLNAPHRYRWWQGGQSIADTLRELGAPETVWRRNTRSPYPEEGR